MFWTRDPEGMRACLDGSEVPPWDVVEALLHDLAAGYGARAAERETERARALHAASLTAFDARPGGHGLLGERLDMMLTEQRFAVERQVELGYSLAAAGTPDEVERLNRDLAWVRDDHERATARCAELRERIERLDRADRPQWVDFGTPVSDDFAAVGADDFGEGPAGDSDAGAADHFRHRAAALEAEEFDDLGDQTRNAFGAPAPARAAEGFGASARGAEGFGGGGAGGFGVAGTEGSEPGASAADGFGGVVGGLGAGAVDMGGPVPEFGASSADQGVSAADARTLSADPSSQPGPDAGPDPDAPRVPKQGRKPRDGSRRPRRPRGARFAGFAGVDDDEGADVAAGGEVAVPQTSEQRPVANSPRGARFGHAADGPGGRGEGGRRDDAGPDRDAERVTAEAVAALIKLRGEGRSGEAHGVLVEAAGWPARHLPVFAGELHRAGLGADWSTLLWEAASLPPDRLVALADALAGAGRADDCRKLLRQGVSRPAPEIAEAVLALIDAGREREARALLDAYIRVRTPEDTAGCAHTDPYRLIPLLLQAAQGVSDERHWDLVHALRVAGFSA